MSKMTTVELLQWLMGAGFAIVSGGAGLWAKSIHSTLRSIEDKLGKLDNFQGRVDTKLDDHERRITRLEEHKDG